MKRNADLADLPLPGGIRSRLLDNINGLTMHVLEAGYEDGRPCLLLLHGFPELAYSWRNIMLPLAAAGFHVRPANTPEKLAQLKTLKPLKILTKQQGGKPFFVVADPYECMCLYVGNQNAYDAYQKLSLQKQFADDRLEAAEINEDTAMDWGMWGPWGAWY